MRRNGSCQPHVTANDAASATRCGTAQMSSARVNVDVGFTWRVALDSAHMAALRGHQQGQGADAYPLTHFAIAAHKRGLATHHSRIGIDKKAAADFRARVNIYPG